jgi:hypothetical protein
MADLERRERYCALRELRLASRHALRTRAEHGIPGLPPWSVLEMS